jgi:hypothetical protein
LTLLVHQKVRRHNPSQRHLGDHRPDPKDNRQLPERATYLLASLREANASAAERG